jgi:hypothetical protein
MMSHHGQELILQEMVRKGMENDSVSMDGAWRKIQNAIQELWEAQSESPSLQKSRIVVGFTNLLKMDFASLR